MHSENPLGKISSYPKTYDPNLLFCIERSTMRQTLGLTDHLPFHGEDIWTAYELSYLDTLGKPVVLIGQLRIPANSLFIVESKSLKLYFNSLNNIIFENHLSFKNQIEKDLSQKLQIPIQFDVWQLDKVSILQIQKPKAKLLDHIIVACKHYEPNPMLLKTNNIATQETLYSNLLKTNCPITHQPDWASIVIQYKGPEILHSSLLEYIVSYRQHNDFHEHCVERIFIDILNYCKPQELTIYAQYTRRGGLDINPYRSNKKNLKLPVKFKRFLRQ